MYYGFSLEPAIKSIARIVDPRIQDEKKRDEDCKFLDLVKSDNKHELRFEVKMDEDLELEPLMVRQGDDNMPNRVFIAGSSLSGKSYMATQLAKDYKRQFKDRKINLFSFVEGDKNLNNKNLGKRFSQIPVDESILDDPIELDECTHRLVILDDIKAFGDKKICEELQRLGDRLVNAGRHYQADVIITSQMLLNAHKGRDILNGCFQVIAFPHSSGRYQLAEYLKRYLFLPKEKIDRILNLPSRWVVINVANPQYVLYSKGAYMLNT